MVEPSIYCGYIKCPFVAREIRIGLVFLIYVLVTRRSMWCLILSQLVAQGVTSKPQWCRCRRTWIEMICGWGSVPTRAVPSGYFLHSHGFSMAPVEIDGFPGFTVLKNRIYPLVMTNSSPWFFDGPSWNRWFPWVYLLKIVYTLWLWLTVRHGFSMAPVEIDGFPGFTVLKNGDFSFFP